MIKDTHIIRKLGAISLILAMLAGLTTGCKQEENTTEAPVTYETFEKEVDTVSKVTKTEDGTEVPVQLNFWYTDTDMAPYYEAAAADFHERYGIEVICTNVSDVNYGEQINKANIDGTGPDVMIAANSDVKKFRMAGLIAENTWYTDEFWNEQYPQIAKAACTSGEKQYGYPVYFDTCMMIYDTAVTTQPESFGSITDFAVNFEDETNSKVIFRWDIADPFFDYLFLGTGADILGATGEDKSHFQVNNDAVIQNLTYFQSLHEYFSIDVDTSTYEQVKSELVNGTLVYGMVKTDVLKELGTYGSSYALCPVPALSAELPVQNLSVTYGAYVSPFTKQAEYANLFAAYLSYEYANNLYGLCQRVASRATIDRPDANEAMVYNQYCSTVAAPKALENGDFWIDMEICFKNIWGGSDVASELNQLQTVMTERLQ